VYILAAAVAAKAITLILVLCQSCAVKRQQDREDETEYGPDGKKLSRKEKKERAALLAEERIKSMEEGAKAKYREKNASLYEKYGVITK
jgi:hypothetical protein